MQVEKRNGIVVDFDESKIIKAVQKAFQAVKKDTENIDFKSLLKKIEKNIPQNPKKVEEIQDTIVIWLHENKIHDVGIAFTKYRERRALARENDFNSIHLVDEYLSQIDDMAVHENSSTMYSLQGLNNHIFSSVSEQYWLSFYSDEIKEAFNRGRIHIHDLQSISAYCCGWDLKALMLEGFGGVSGKPSSAPPRHLSTALSQANNFIFTLQGETSGANAFSNFNTLMAPFVRTDNLSYVQVKQEIQQFIYNLNISTRVGFQSPFSNLTLDLDTTKVKFADEPAIVGGELMDFTYADCNKEATWINQAIVEVLGEGDKDGAMLSYPIVTFNVTSDFPWHNKLGRTIQETTAKYGSFYFSNYINSEYSASDVTSMCCRLRINHKEIESHLGEYTGGLEEKDYAQTHQKGHGFFGASPNTGSVGVVTLGMPAIMQDIIEEGGSWDDFLNKVKYYMDLAMESLLKKRKEVEFEANRGLYPYLAHYLRNVKKRTGHYFTQHFSTICPNGVHEALYLYGLEDGIMCEEGLEKTEELLKFMNDYTIQLQKENRVLVNLEQAPAESASIKMMKKSGVDPLNNGYWTNSTWQPADTNIDLVDLIKMQGRLNVYYSGGSSMHTYTQSDIVPIAQDLHKIIMYAFTETKIPYMTISPVFSVCEKCGRISGKHEVCPKCGSKNINIYERIVGYYRAHQNWNHGKLKESKKRHYLEIKNLDKP